jgi:hypothetical protein
MFQPWKGREYDSTRLLILGESTYSWLEADERRHPSPQHSIETVRWAIDNFPNCGRFFAMVSRALANEENPTKDRLQYVWDRVAFTNYVSVTVSVTVEDGPRTRPTPVMWADAKRDFLPEVSKLAPKRVIVLGTTMWGEMPEADIYITDDVQGYRLGDGEIMMCCAVNHPAGGLSWRKLASVVHFTYEREFRG